MSKTPESHLQLDKEIKQCAITQPYEALQSNFAKKLVGHLLPHSKFKEEHIKGIVQKLEDETETLTPEEGKDFLEFMQENKDFFDGLIKRYQ